MPPIKLLNLVISGEDTLFDECSGLVLKIAHSVAECSGLAVKNYVM